uniref:BZIP domain-containing protein n=1 Tax=Kryptolebias marmoratus TaxID=37003 RepID=A0A3Q2ZZV5_KRYMA
QPHKYDDSSADFTNMAVKSDAAVGPRVTKKREKNRDAARKSRRKQTERADELHEVRHARSWKIYPFVFLPFLLPFHSSDFQFFSRSHTPVCVCVCCATCSHAGSRFL